MHETYIDVNGKDIDEEIRKKVFYGTVFLIHNVIENMISDVKSKYILTLSLKSHEFNRYVEILVHSNDRKQLEDYELSY